MVLSHLLLVAKSWAEVVKLGVARPQSKIAKKSVRKGRPLKRRNYPPKVSFFVFLCFIFLRDKQTAWMDFDREAGSS